MEIEELKDYAKQYHKDRVNDDQANQLRQCNPDVPRPTHQGKSSDSELTAKPTIVAFKL